MVEAGEKVARNMAAMVVAMELAVMEETMELAAMVVVARAVSTLE